MAPSSTMTVRDTIERDLADEPQSVVKVYETAQLRTDIREYVLTDRLAQDFARALRRVVDAAKPAGERTDRIGIWVSGFFGSGKSHFAKLVGHLLADTPTADGSARTLFQRLLHSGRPSDDEVAGLLQEATICNLACHLVAFDITAMQSVAAERNVALTLLHAFHQSLGLSRVIPFAERELELQAAGKFEEFTTRFAEKSTAPWAQCRDRVACISLLAQCLAEVLPDIYPSATSAEASLQLALNEAVNLLTIDDAVARLLDRLEARQKQEPIRRWRLLFVADEVGAWAGRDLRRIE